MNTKTIVALIVVIIVLVGGYFLMQGQTAEAPAEGERVMQEGETADEGKLKVGNFEGELQEVNTGCYADGECFVVVDGKHITTLMGWSQDVWGTADFDTLSTHIGSVVEVYAKDNGDGTYSLKDSAGFYVRVKE